MGRGFMANDCTWVCRYDATRYLGPPKAFSDGIKNGTGRRWDKMRVASDVLLKDVPKTGAFVVLNFTFLQTSWSYATICSTSS
jgi:hypothetical protein